MQVAAAYIDVESSATVRGVFGDVNKIAIAADGLNPTLTEFPGSPIRSPRALPTPLTIAPSEPTQPSRNSSDIGSVGAKFFHLALSLEAFVASPCSPGETAELYFSLYNRGEARFLTEEFCVILNHHGAPAKVHGVPSSGTNVQPNSAYPPSASPNNAGLSPSTPAPSTSKDYSQTGGLGKIRTLFTDLGAHDIQDSIYLVCRIVRNGAMKMSGVSSSSGYPSGNVRRGSEAVLATLSENESTMGANSTAAFGGMGGQYRQDFENALGTLHQTYRRPFGCAVLELTQLAKWGVDQAEATQTREHTLPIFVPTREIAFSTLHQAIIGSETTEFEKSPR